MFKKNCERKTPMTPQTPNRTAERGNALFLILIAVALFAALSYAVTRSGRGSGSIGRETGLINSSQLTQFPASLRTAVTRLILTGTSVTDLTFDPTDTSPNGVFSPNGGGVVYQAPPSTGIVSTIDATNAGPHWRYKGIPSGAGGYYILGIGSNTSAGRDAFAFVGVNPGTCSSINQGLGLSTVPAIEGATAFSTAGAAADAPSGQPGNNDEGMPAHGGGDTTGAGATAASNYAIGKFQTATNTSPQAFGCVSNSNGTSGPFIYYHALIEQ